MKRTIFGLLAVLLAFGLILAGCAGPTDPLGSLARKAAGDEIRLGEDQKALAKEVLPFESARKNASGDKIPSNAHSADFPGLYFYWADKQKADECFLLVKTSVFEEYKGFLLTKKVSNTYWDYPIGKASEDNIITANGEEWYLYRIPSGKAYYVWEDGEDGESVAVLKDQQLKQNGNGSFNINMVFIPEFEPIDKPPSEIWAPAIDTEKYVISFEKAVYDSKGNKVDFEDWKEDAKYFWFDLYLGDELKASRQLDGSSVVTFEVDSNDSYTVKERIDGTSDYAAPPEEGITVFPSVQKKTVSIISRDFQEGGTFAVDPAGTWKMPGESRDIKTQWNETLAGDPAYADLAKFGPAWIWDRPDSWMWGTTGSEIIHYTTEFVIDDLADIVLRDGASDPAKGKYGVPIWFAADNAAVLYVNGSLVRYTDMAIKGAVENYYEFTDLSDAGFDGNKWQKVYYADLYPFLQEGPNSVVFFAANSEHVAGDTQNDGYNITNNPCGLIFASVINMEKKLEGGGDGEFANVQKDLRKAVTIGSSGGAGWAVSGEFPQAMGAVLDRVTRFNDNWDMAIELSAGETRTVDLLDGKWDVIGKVTLTDTLAGILIEIEYGTDEVRVTNSSVTVQASVFSSVARIQTLNLGNGNYEINKSFAVDADIPLLTGDWKAKGDNLHEYAPGNTHYVVIHTNK